MEQPWQQQRGRRSGHGGRLRLLRALLVLLSLCLARLDAAAAASAASTDLKDGVATALEKAEGQEAARGFTATTAEEEGPARVAMEVIEDYPSTRANSRHSPSPYP